ncbi:hypothetical protein ASZ90_017385 [hydrocarbon metagenome]|uniref:Uncharacterized protein n=1 Tax=hydrocarbon metagenome TaxID=938273 RepID=A0A0W8E986_9ZZZZ
MNEGVLVLTDAPLLFSKGHQPACSMAALYGGTAPSTRDREELSRLLSLG